MTRTHRFSSHFPAGLARRIPHIGHTYTTRTRGPVSGCCRLGVLAMLCVALAGCADGNSGAADDLAAGRTTSSRGESTRRTFDPDEAADLFRAAAAGADPAGRRDAWSIVLAAFSGEDQQRDAELVLAAVGDIGLAGANLETRRDNTVLTFGAYEDPDDPEAARDLRRIRQITLDGRTPFAGAFLAPPTAEAGTGRTPEYDLRYAKALHNPGALDTPEIAVYARADRRRPRRDGLEQFRAAAEEAVRSLRAEGEPAFFYHGPNRSSVTLGLFNGDDHDPETPQFESTRLRMSRDRHPTLLLNGAGLRETVRTSSGTATRLKPTYLVGVPDPD